MFLATGIILLIISLVIICAIAFTTARKINVRGEIVISKKNLIYLVPTYLLIYVLHMSAWLYNGNGLDFFSGFSLIFGQNIREGDVVDVAGINGVVQKVSLRATQIRTYDNAIVFVPNSEFLSATFVNWTHNGTMVRKSIPIGVAYDSDLKEVTDTVMQVVKAQPDILSYPEPSFFFMNFGASSLDFELRIWIQDLDKAMGIMTRVRLAINEAFKEKGIEIPFPQSEIHVYHKKEDEYQEYDEKNEKFNNFLDKHLG